MNLTLNLLYRTLKNKISKKLKTKFLNKNNPNNLIQKITIKSLNHIQSKYIDTIHKTNQTSFYRLQIQIFPMINLQNNKCENFEYLLISS